MKHLIAMLALACAGCSTMLPMETFKPPAREIVVQWHPTFLQSWAACARLMHPAVAAASFLTVTPILGCAYEEFETGRCTVHAASSSIADHEIEHCLGRDHWPHSMRRAYEAWRGSP